MKTTNGVVLAWVVSWLLLPTRVAPAPTFEGGIERKCFANPSCPALLGTQDDAGVHFLYDDLQLDFCVVAHNVRRWNS